MKRRSIAPALAGLTFALAPALPGTAAAPRIAEAQPPDGAVVPGVPVLPAPPGPVDLNARTLHVGSQAEYPTPSAAAAAAHDGDTIEIAGGDYHGDVATWSANRLKIVGVGTRPRIFADGKDVQGKGTWLVRGDDVLVQNVEMSGARVADHNGAAIRLEGRNFTLRDAYLHDNENGLLTGANPTSEIVVEHCEFARNGFGDGYTHNIYVGAVARFSISRSYLHHAVVGHNLKSRALVSVLTDNRLADEADGRASYEADFPNGGRVTLAFNIFQKGPAAENGTLVSYGAEGLAPGGDHALVVKGNTFVSRRGGGTRFLFIASGTRSAIVNGNVFAGPGSLPDLAGIKANNAVQKEMPGNADLKPDGFH